VIAPVEAILVDPAGRFEEVGLPFIEIDFVPAPPELDCNGRTEDPTAHDGNP
jgi:hypothetical protein